MPWLETFTLVIAAIAVLIAAGSLVISRTAHRISTIQALPRVAIVRTWSSTGERDLYIELEQKSDRPDWVVASVGIRRTWRHWHQLCFLARGEVIAHDEFEQGQTLPITRRTGDWERRITYEHPITDGAVFLHPDAPDCEITLEITLNTSPSPTLKRHIKSLKEFPSRPRRQSVVE